MYNIKRNQKGGAAIVAVMIMIILIAAGSVVMVVTGRGSINESENIPAAAYSTSSEEESSSEADSEVESEAEPEPEPEPEPTVLIAYPEKSLNYKDIEIENLTAEAAILVDTDNNAILAGKGYEDKIYPASLTKVMTLVVAVENIEDLQATFTLTSDIIDPLIEENASRAGFEAGETVTYEDLLYASILVSGADGTSGLANAIAGSEEEFVALMNAKAEELGLNGTHFVNASGLHDENHYSTCEDLAVIMEYALKNEECKKILTTVEYTTTATEQHEEGIKLTSIVASRLNGYYIEGGGDITGGKTGFTDEAGYSLISICEKDGRNYICVTVKSDGQWTSVEDNIAVYESYLPASETDEAEDTADTEESTDTEADTEIEE